MIMIFSFANKQTGFVFWPKLYDTYKMFFGVIRFSVQSRCYINWSFFLKSSFHLHLMLRMKSMSSNHGVCMVKLVVKQIMKELQSIRNNGQYSRRYEKSGDGHFNRHLEIWFSRYNTMRKILAAFDDFSKYFMLVVSWTSSVMSSAYLFGILKTDQETGQGHVDSDLRIFHFNISDPYVRSHYD